MSAAVVSVVARPGVAEVHEAFEAYKLACENAEKVLAGDRDAELQIQNAQGDKDEAERERKELVQEISRIGASGPDAAGRHAALEELRRRKADAERRELEAKAKLADGVEFRQGALDWKEEARKRYDQLLRREVDFANERVVARLPELARVRDDAATRYNRLADLKVKATNMLAARGQDRAKIADLEETWAEIRAALGGGDGR